MKAKDWQTTINDDNEHNCKNTAINWKRKTVVKTKEWFMRESKKGLNWRLHHIERHQEYTHHRGFQFIKQHLFWTVLDRPFLFKLLLCLLYQISEHIIVQITFIIILVVSLLSLPKNKMNSHFLNTCISASFLSDCLDTSTAYFLSLCVKVKSLV